MKVWARRTAIVAVLAVASSLLIAVAPASLVAVAPKALAPAPALAHFTCGGDANGPFKSGGNIEGRVFYLCEGQHDKYHLNGCLQKKVSGNWQNRVCPANPPVVFGPGLQGVRSVSLHFVHGCSTGKWRTLFKYGAAFNEQGQKVHEQTINEASPVTDVNSC